MAVQLLSQRDKRWKDIKLGTSNTTIGDFGCTITAIAMIVGTTPDVVNERLKQVAGFSQGNLVIWASIDKAFPGIHARRVWTYDNADVKANVKRVLVEVDGKPIGGFRHWVVFVGSQKLYDPWDGKEDPTSDYPDPVSYCVLEGAWEKGQEVPTTDLGNELTLMRNQRDDNNRDRMALYEELGGTGKFDKSWAVTEIQQFKKIAEESKEKDVEIKKLREDLRVEKENLRLAREEIKLMKDNNQAVATNLDRVEGKVDVSSGKVGEIEKQIEDKIKSEPKSNVLDLILEWLSSWKIKR